MANDIVTRLNTEEMTKAFYKAFPRVVTLEDVMRQTLEGSDEIEILRDKCKHLEAELARFERLSNG